MCILIIYTNYFYYLQIIWILHSDPLKFYSCVCPFLAHHKCEMSLSMVKFSKLTHTNCVLTLRVTMSVLMMRWILISTYLFIFDVIWTFYSEDEAFTLRGTREKGKDPRVEAIQDLKIQEGFKFPRREVLKTQYRVEYKVYLSIIFTLI